MLHGDLTGNFAYIDNQNLYMSTTKAQEPWELDMYRFRVYLHEKYKVVKAYLFMGAHDYSYQDIYSSFQQYGYILVFREHGIELKGKKKGNVDADIVFEMMRDAYTNTWMERAILVSGDGDYYRTVKYLLDTDKLARILLPSKTSASSLYKRLPESNKAYLDTENIKAKIGRKKK